MANFIDKLIDWQDFEKFIRDIYELDPDMVVKHNVTLEGKSGAKRQIDVLLTHKSKLHTYVTVVECKRWKEKVDRGIIDILYATIEDINASKGVIFMSKGAQKLHRIIVKPRLSMAASSTRRYQELVGR